ncbi:hypothetical protein BTE77_27940 [Ensifer adhaerens]|nr:hypothetical protein BTE77_27940 [Ensifer adhaerens]
MLTKSFPALATVAGYLIVRAAGDGVDVATGNADPLIAVGDSMGADAGSMLDATLSGIAEVRAGGTFSFGDLLTADAEGRAIKAEPVAGILVRTIGVAHADADEGDIAPVHVSPGAIG